MLFILYLFNPKRNPVFGGTSRFGSFRMHGQNILIAVNTEQNPDQKIVNNSANLSRL